MSARDYSRAELEAIEWLSRQTWLDGWVSFTGAIEPAPGLREACPDHAATLDAITRRDRRLRRACLKLHGRELVERGRHPISGSLAYRLIPLLRSNGADDEVAS